MWSENTPRANCPNKLMSIVHTHTHTDMGTFLKSKKKGGKNLNISIQLKVADNTLLKFHMNLN